MLANIRREVNELTEQLIAWRRDFHRHPEIAFEEHRTSAVIRKFLESLGIQVDSYAGTGLRGILTGKPGGPTVALRADMDALPLQEEGDKEYISQNPGAAHACGHDGHMAVVMGAAKILTKYLDQLNGNVVFLFQPSEERFPGGAAKMIEEGALEGVDAIFGLHFWQGLPTGKVGVVPGPVMAQPDTFEICIKGKGGHGSIPHQTVDPIYVASQIVVNVQSIVSRNCDPLKPLVVSFGTINGGTINNVIPNQVSLTGTVRTFDPEIQSLAEQRLREIAEGTCQIFGAEMDLFYHQGYPTLINDEGMANFTRAVLRATLGENSLQPFDPVMGGEDFSYFLQKVPGTFLFFGMGDGMDHPHHHPSFDMDERALPPATQLLISLAMEYFKRD